MFYRNGKDYNVKESDLISLEDVKDILLEFATEKYGEEKIKLNYKAIFSYSVKVWSVIAFVAGLFGWEALPTNLLFINECVIYKLIFILLIWATILFFVFICVCYCIYQIVVYGKLFFIG